MFHVLRKIGLIDVKCCRKLKNCLAIRIYAGAADNISSNKIHPPS
jgi:hypothetical protein